MAANVVDGHFEYYCKSDVVPKDVITKFTKDCKNVNCEISCQYLGGTMLGMSRCYNKNGELIVDDPNRMDIKIACIACLRYETVHRKLNGAE